LEDIAIAATAAGRGLSVLGAGERRFAPLGVPLVHPLKQLLERQLGSRTAGGRKSAPHAEVLRRSGVSRAVREAFVKLGISSDATLPAARKSANLMRTSWWG